MSPARVTILDEQAGTVTVRTEHGETVHAMASAAGLAAASAAWLRAGWDAKHVYSFSWLGRPIIQLPEDMIRLQEVIWALQPDVILETGVAHGGSLIFYASLCRAIGRGRVIGVDIEIRPPNRAAIEAHPLAGLITLIEGNSVAPEQVERVAALIAPGETVLVLLDSNHSKDHVLAELRAYGPLVSPGSWIVACDGIMAAVAGGPRTRPDRSWNNPLSAVEAFLAERDDFALDIPAFPFNESVIERPVSYWPNGWLRRRRR
jgi:cephalosporin hydroxylase